MSPFALNAEKLKVLFRALYDFAIDTKMIPPNGRNIKEMKERRQLDRLTNALTNENWRVRRDAAQALGEICDPSSAKQLVPFALLDPEVEVRRVATDACVALGISTVQVLIGILHDFIDWAYLVDENAFRILKGPQRFSGLQDLSFISPKDPRCLALTGKGKEEAINRAKEILKRMRGTPVVEALIAMLQKKVSYSPEDVFMRQMQSFSRKLDIEFYTSSTFAAVALGEIGDPRAVEALIAARYEPGKPFPNSYVEDALTKIGSSGLD